MLKIRHESLDDVASYWMKQGLQDGTDYINCYLTCRKFTCQLHFDNACTSSDSFQEVIITVGKFQWFDWLRGVKLIINFCVTKENTLWGPAESQNAKNNHGNLICVSRSVDYTFLCTQKQKQTLPSKWKRYCTADESLFQRQKWIGFAVLQTPMLTLVASVKLVAAKIPKNQH